MERQLIISVGREFGSSGHEIAEELARRFDIPLYDSNLLECIAQERKLDGKLLGKYDEKPKNRLLYRKVKGFSNSPQENVANLQFQYLKKMAEEGKSFVIVGRCAETKLKEFPALVSVFILGRTETKIQRIVEKYHVLPAGAAQMMKREDASRKSYHNYHCQEKWGDSRTYDLTVNSSYLGVLGTADVIESYIRKRMEA